MPLVFLITILGSISLNASASETIQKPFCNLHSKDIPKLILIGETHADERSIKIRETIMAAGAQGKYPVASETASFSRAGAFLPFYQHKEVQNFGGQNKTSLLSGIESPIPYAITVSYFLQIDNIVGQSNPEIATRNLIEFCHELPLLSGALRNLKANIKLLVPGEKMARLVSQMEALSTNEDYNKLSTEDRVEFFSKELDKQYSPEELRKFLTLLHAETIKIVNEKYLPYFDGKPLPVIKNKFDKWMFGCSGVPCTPTGRFKDILTVKRSRDFAVSIGNLLCTYKGKYSHVVAIMGYNHVAGVKEILAELSENSLGITVFSSDENDGSSILTEVGRIRARNVAPVVHRVQRSSGRDR